MTTHCGILAWRIPWMEEPGGLQSMGSLRVGDNWSDLACIHALEKEMAAPSSVLAWRIPGTEKPGGLPSVGLHRVRHDWSNLAAAAAATLFISHFTFLATLNRKLEIQPYRHTLSAMYIGRLLKCFCVYLLHNFYAGYVMHKLLLIVYTVFCEGE